MLVSSFRDQTFRDLDQNSVIKFYDHYQKCYRNTCDTTISERHLYLNCFFSWCIEKIPDSKFISLDFLNLRSFMDYYTCKYSSGSLNWMIQTLRSFLNFCFINDQLKSNFHVLLQCRHSFASVLLQKSEPLKIISGMLGHRSSESTMIYTKIDIAGLRNAVHEWEE